MIKNKWNLSKQAKTSISIEEKRLIDDRKKFKTEADDNTGNVEWLLKQDRKDLPNDQILETQLDSVRKYNDSNPILEAQLDKATKTLNQLRISDEEAKPLMDFAVEHEQKRAKAFNKANNEGKAERDTSFWDKYIGDQLTIEKTVITNNVQPSQLLSNYDGDRKAFEKANPSIKKQSSNVMQNLSNADAMLYHIYKTANYENRALTQKEKQMIVDINNDKIYILSQVQRNEEEFTDAEWDEELRYEESNTQARKQEEELEEEIQEEVDKL